ncbi:hypothetical protein EPI10_026134 [Gossypium australe]|uniref:Uncharacterized protein n=1 Tax=Gossypium australe TaxID=47621 RepID=A0A5B6W458_9ROSI|nr:hypothetical protein EPI10_026134 [Gossypium australe]
MLEDVDGRSYYIIEIPCAVLLSFVLNVGGKNSSCFVLLFANAMAGKYTCTCRPLERILGRQITLTL